MNDQPNIERPQPIDFTTFRPRHPERGERIAWGEPLYNRVMDFLIVEAGYLDDNLLDEWLALLAPGIVYAMPVRQARNRRDGDGFQAEMNFFCEGMHSLAFKVKRMLTTEDAFAEDPPSRVTRSVSNLQLFRTATADEVLARSNLVMLRYRGEQHQPQIFSAKREDIISLAGEECRLLQRTIYSDQSVIGMANLAVFL